MTDQATIPDPQGHASIQAFLDKHGAPPTAEVEGRDPRSAREPSSESPNSADSSPELDPATLQALGLMPEPAAKPPADREEDGATEGRQVDLTALAEALGLSPEDLSHDGKALKLKTKVDGQESEVSLADLRKGYQLQSHFTKQQEAFLAERQQWEQARQAEEAKLRQVSETVQGLMAREEEALNREYTRDWDALRQQDPAEYAAQVADYNRRLMEIRGRRQAVGYEIEQRMQEQEKARMEHYQQVVSVEQGRLAEALGWSTQEARNAGGQLLQDYLFKRVGMTPEQLAPIMDHRVFVLYDKARRYDDLVSKIATAKKRVAEAPTVLSEKEVPPSAPAVRHRAREDALKRHRSEHSVDSAAQVFRQLKVV